MNHTTNLHQIGLPRRILALALAIFMVMTVSPPLTAASAVDSGNVTLLSGFAPLSGEVRLQNVPLGVSSVDLVLPDMLEAYPAEPNFGDTEELPPAESEPEELPPTPSEPEELPPAESEPEDTENSETPPESSADPENAPPESSSAPESAPDAPPSESSEPTLDESSDEQAQPSPAESTATGEISHADAPTTQVLSAYVESDIAEAEGEAATPAAVTVEGITWTSEPAFDGDTAGTYIFTAVLPSGYAVEDGVAMPEITVTVGHILEYGDCMDFTCLTHYPPEVLAEMNEDEDPVPLTLEDLINDYGIEPPAPRRTRAAANPQTMMVTTDNENNAHTGTADGDLDLYMSDEDKINPIEIAFTIPADKMPTQSAFLAVKAFDVDEEDLRYEPEHDYVYINDDIFLPQDITEPGGTYNKYNQATIGYLSGTSNTWNTTVLEIPLEKLKPGKNVISITLSPYYWLVAVDWVQLILDGGEKDANIDSFSLKLGVPINTSDSVQVPATVTIQQKGNTQYVTEYSLIQTATGNTLDAKFGKAQTAETVSLSIPLNSQTGTYKIIGILKDPSTEAIKAHDEVEFQFTQGVGTNLAPRLTHMLTPSGLTNQSVAIAVTVADASGCTDISIQDGGVKSVAANGDYAFTVNYKTPSGEAKTMTYTVSVTNIDNTLPIIAFNPFTVAEETSDAEVATLFKSALSASAKFGIASGGLTYTLPANIAATAGTKNVTVTATDTVGNTATKICAITVTPLPLKLVQNTPARVGVTNSFTLSARLTNIGGDTITETGFVWGIMQSPTTAVNNGRAKTTSAVTAKGGTITITAADIADGVNYYTRPYAIAGGKTLYGDQKPFALTNKNYGTFTVTNNGDNTFTITRTGGTDDAQKVYYRTVNGSAVGGTHFEHTGVGFGFAAGETSRTVTVKEFGVNAVYGSKAGTAYSNANRTYQLEVYQVEGGGTVTGGVSRATRTMTGNTTIDRSIYTREKFNMRPAPSAPAWWVHDRSGGNAGDLYFVHNRSGAQSDFTNWNASASISDSRYTSDQANYLNATSPNYLYRYALNAYENKDGWEHAWIGNHVPNNVATKTKASGSYTGKAIALDDANIGSGLWSGVFQVPQGGSNDLIFPQSNTGGAEDSGKTTDYKGDTTTVDSKEYVKLGINETAYSYFAATGNTENNWQVRGFTDYILPYDTVEPQMLGVAPMAGGIYKPGDSVTIAIVFDEIVDSTNSPNISTVTLDTSYGTMRYAGGADTNVLYFTGIVPSTVNGPSIIEVNGINNNANIRDMCDQIGTLCAVGGNTGSNIVTDSTRPGVVIDNNGITNGTAKGTITASNYSSLKYTWSQSSTPPVSGWIHCFNNTVAQTRQTTGVWYLHAIAEYSGNGTSSYTNTSFNFNTTTSPLPTLAVSADNTNWAHSRNITVARTPAAATVTYSGPQSGTASGGTVTVTQNGLYTFTLTSGGETITEMVSVSRLDAIAPTLTLREPGGAGAVYNTLTFAADAADNLSGIAKVEYAVTGTNGAPSSGWQALSNSGGSYNGSYTETAAATKTTKYIHVRATDAAGNVTTKTSAAYTVVKENAAAAPVITLTGAPTSWTKGPVNLTWNVTNVGAGGISVLLNGTTSSATSGTLAATGNGLYSVSVTDQNGVSANASLLVDKIDAEAPILTKLSSPTGWATSKTVTVTGVTDNRTPLPDASGTTTGYGGSGLKTQEWKLDNGGYTTFTGSSFTATAAGTYTVRLTDNAGNQNEYTVQVSQVDTTAPSVTVGIPDAGWTSAAQNIAVTYTDSQSGISTAQYAITTTNSGTKPTTLTNLPASGGTVSVSTNGTSYIYYKVTDNAGNVKDGYSNPIKVDTTTPTLTLSGGKTGVLATANLQIDVARSFGSSGGKVEIYKDSSLVKTLGDSESFFNISSSEGHFKVTATSNAGKSVSEELDVYVITMDANGGSGSKNQKVVGGGTVAEPTASKPTRTGYTLTGWQKDGTAYDFTTPVNGNITLIAVWTLNAPTVSLAVDKATATYNAGNTVATLTATPRHTASGVTYTYEWYRDSTKLSGTGSTMPLTDAAHSGSYTVMVTASAGGLTSAQVTSSAVEVSIAKADVELTAPTASGIIYGQTLSNSTLTDGAATQKPATVSARMASLFRSGTAVGGSFTWTTPATNPAVADSGSTEYGITFIPADTANYNTATTTQKLTVSKATLTPSVASAVSREYNGGTDASGTLSLAGAVLGQDPTASGTFAFTAAGVGTNKPVNITGIALDGTWGNNYALSAMSLSNAATTAEITPKVIGLEWSGHTGLTYTGNPMNVTSTATGLVSPDGCTVTVTGGTQANAGTHTATATAVSNSNYKLPTTVTQAYTIAKAPVTFAVTNDTYIYDASAKAATVAQTAGETPDVSGKFTVHYEQSGSTVASPTNKGQYDIIVTITNANFKHSGQADGVTAFKVGTLTIDGTPYPDADTMTWPTAAGITYGQTLADSALTGGDQTAKGSYAWKDGTTVPTVTNSGYTVVFTPTDTNYATVEHTVSVSVAKATPTLALPTAAGITYGETLVDSALSGGSASATYNGAANTDVPGSYAWTAPATKPTVADSNSTDYGLTFTPDDTDNYNIVTSGEIKLAVTAKAVGLDWHDHQSLVYTAAPVNVIATATGLETGDSCTVTVTGGTETNAGAHTATATAVSNGNYKLPAAVTQSYTIAKAPVSFAVSDNTHDYDSTAKTATVTQTASETPDVSGQFTVSYEKGGSPVASPTAMGVYNVFVELTDPNFKHKNKADSAVKTQVGLLTINGIEYPDAGSMTWPTADPLTYGQTLGDSMLTGGDQATKGTYTWTTPDTVPTVQNDGYWVLFTPTDTNYSTVDKVIDIVVNKETPSLTLPKAKDITYGDTLADSSLTGGSASTTYNGTANTDVPGQYKWTTPAAKPAVADSDSTEFALTFTPTDTDNYNVVTSGKVKLTVAQREATLRWSGHTGLTYTGGPVAVTAAVTNLVDTDSCAVTVTDGAKTAAGAYTATATALDNGNYKLPADVTQAYTIAKAPVTFAVTANEHDYDATAKTATVTQTASETPSVAGKFTVSYAKDGNPVAAPTNAGVYDVVVTLTDANFKHKDKEDTVLEIKVGTLTINGVKYPQADTMTWPTAANITYGQTLSDSTLTGGDQTASGGYAWKDGNTVPTVTNSGYTVVFTPTDGNYAPVEKIINITVAKATPTLELPTAAGITYGKTLADSTLSGGSAKATYNGADRTVPGRYTWTTSAAMPKVSDGNSTEYALTFTPTDTANYNAVTTGKVKLAVAQKSVGLTWAGHTALVYNGSAVNVTATATGLVGGDSCTVTVTDGGKTDAGAYTAKATAVSNPNYKLPDITEQAYTIAKKPLKVLWSDMFPTYDGTQKYPTLALEGIVNGEDCTVISTGSAAAGNAGRYKVEAALQGTRSTNYTMQNPGEILAIQPAPVSISLSDYSYKYDGAAKYATVTATPDVPLAVTYKLAGNEVTAPTEEGIYDILVELNGKNYRFAEGTDGKARRMGALTIYKEKPPELYTITFASGAEDAAGTAPTLPAAVKDTVHFLPSNSFLRGGHAFVGWKNGETLYQPGERFIQPANNSTVFTAQWEAATYDIGGVVDQDGKPVANVRVILMRGAEQVAETVTNQIGEYHFDSVLPGLYNLVASKPSPDGVGDIIMTIMVEVKAADVEQANITLPSGKTNSIVEVAPGTPKIIVGNLDKTFKNTEGSDYTPEDKEVVNKGGTVEIKFIAEEKQKSEITGDAEEISKEAGNAKIGLYLALDVEKTVTQPANPDTPDVEPPSDTTPVPETSVLLESVIPLPSDLQGKQSYTVYRVHESTVDSLTTGADSGERIEVSEDKTTLTLYAQKFSTYAIAYTERSGGGGGDDDDGGGSGSGGSDWKPKPDPIKPEQPAPVAPVVPAPGTDVPGTIPNPTQPDATQPGSPEADGADKEKTGEDTTQKPDGGNNETQKDEIRDALEDAINNLPDTLTDEQRQEYIDRLTEIADAAIAALDGTSDPDEARRIAEQAQEDIAKIVAEALALASGTAKKPFVLTSALLALAAALLAVFALLKRRDKKRKLFSAIFAALAVATFLLTSGWSGFALANGWTLVVAAFAICAAMGVFVRYSKQEDEDAAEAKTK